MVSFIEQLKSYENDYKSFMGIEQFPRYTVQTKEVSLSTAESQGFEAAAAAFYQPETKQHTLLISTNLSLFKQIVFHEFTHILDSEVYVNGDNIRYAGLSGYTEYHASQVELAFLLGANSIDNIPSFSVKRILSTYAGEKSVSQYVSDKQKHAMDLFSRNDFPSNLSTLKSALGVLYNYLGLRSICEMYATDYEEIIDNGSFLKHLSTLHFYLINNLMHGWLDQTRIDMSIPLYVNTIVPIIREYNLQ